MGLKKEKIKFNLFDIELFHYRQGQSKKNSKSYITMSSWIRSNIDEEYYKSLDIKTYRRIPEGLPRRLYEYLAKKKNIDGCTQLEIAEKDICRYLMIKDKNVTLRRKRLERISKSLIKVKYLSNYKFSRSSKSCTFSFVA